ncbi:MAG: restriction endonuclease subunit S [Leptospiraceae bacterium]|nr:restriction endonuclease subunit S [Leptospiraceae bacterium]
MRKYCLSELIVELESGSRPEGGVKSSQGEVFSLGAEHLNDYGGFNFKNPRYIPLDFYLNQKKGKLAKNDILLVKDGATTGKVSFVDNSFPYKNASINEHVFRLKIDESRCVPKFLFWFLRSPKGQNQLMKDFRGATVGGITKNFINKVNFNLPPLSEQRRIVKTLDTIQGLIDKRKETIRLLDEYIKAVFLDMFGETEQTATLGELLKSKESFKCGPFGSQLKIGEFVKEGIPVYGIDNVSINGFIDAKPKFITPEKFEELSAFSVSADDILITRTGTVGRSCLAPKKIPKAIIGPNLLKVRCNPSVILPEYLSFALNHDRSVIDQVLSMSPGATVAVYNTTNLKNLRIKVPEIKKQHEFLLRYGNVRKINMLFQDNDHLIKRFFNRVLSQSIT